jgi:indole-3-glycerol phosphate synthase
MTNKLDSIILNKQHEVAALRELISQKPHHTINRILHGDAKRHTEKSFAYALRQPALSVIAEIKRKSPSKGLLAVIENPVQLAQSYVDSGAKALSILTDNHFFGGNLQDLSLISKKFHHHPISILRKDFIIDEIQIAESVFAGADAILAIVAVLGKKTRAILECAKRLGIDVLVEVHNDTELKIAIDCGATIIGVNNRNLNTFKVDIHTTLQLLPHIPQHIIKVAESGITHPDLAKQYYAAGVDAVLIGESLVTAKNPVQFIEECCHV